VTEVESELIRVASAVLNDPSELILTAVYPYLLSKTLRPS